MKIKVRSIFISDIHLGCRYSKTIELLEFLKCYDTEYLYLVGDIFDGWKLKNNFYWDNNCTFIIRHILGMIKSNGTIVKYVTGNHDEFLREITPCVFGDILIADEFIHTTADNKKLLIIHGDAFDHITKHWKWIYFLGDTAYSFAMFLNQWVNFFRRKLGLQYWSFSSVLKQNVKKAVNYINSFEHFIAKHTLDNDCEGVVAGHIHQPCIKDIDGVKYYNCGDFVENCTAIIENLDGSMELIN